MSTTLLNVRRENSRYVACVTYRKLRWQRSWPFVTSYSFTRKYVRIEVGDTLNGSRFYWPCMEDGYPGLRGRDYEDAEESVQFLQGVMGNTGLTLNYQDDN